MLARVWPILALVLVMACGGSSPSAPEPPPPTGSAPYSQTDLVVGTGAEAVAGKTVAIYYILWLYSDTATDHKGTQIQALTTGTPLAFVIGGSGVIPGVNQGVTGMKVGGQRRLVIPPELAYGSQSNGTIPANATLLFEVQLVAVQ
jgi:FKBP-type peptidyl-prolyl cis-trans isomerase FkpA